MKAQMVKNAVIVPGGCQGRLRASSARRPARDRAAFHGGGDPLLQDVPARPARHHRQPGPPGGIVPPRRRGPLRRRRSLSGGGRRQGHGHLLRLSPTRSAASTASGSTTPSPRAARPATTTRRWASPPRAPGNRSSATSASSGSTPRPSRSRSIGIGDMSGDVFGNGMLLSEQDQAGGGLRPPPHLPRSRSRPGPLVRRAPAPVRPAALELGRLRPGADQRRRRRLAAHREVDPADARGSRAVLGIEAESPDADRADERDPEGAGRPVLERRHRHLRQGGEREPRRGAGPPQRRASASMARSCAAASWARAATWAARRKAASSSRSRAGGSTPTSSTTRPASTAPITRSTSRSCCGAVLDAGDLTHEAARRAAGHR